MEFCWNSWTEDDLKTKAKEFAGGSPFPYLRVSDFIKPVSSNGDGSGGGDGKDDANQKKNKPSGADGDDNDDGEETPLYHQMVASLTCLDFVERNSDLFQFYQSKLDLANARAATSDTEYTKVLAAFVRNLYSPTTLAVVQKFLDTAVSAAGAGAGADELDPDHVDVSAFVYGDTDYLLTHDDNVGGSSHAATRRLAFVFYLVPPSWTSANGGALELFEPTSQPPPGPQMTPAATLVPEPNSLVMFQVSDRSWHRVAEVVGDLQRITIAGWFHAKEDKNRPPPPPPSSSSPVPSLADLVPKDAVLQVAPADMDGVIAARYTGKANASAKISQTFADEGSVQLRKFLDDQFVDRLLGGLESEKLSSWHTVGPAHVCKFDQLQLPSPAASSPVVSLLGALQSPAFAQWTLQTFLDNDETSSLQLSCLQVQRFSHDDYTLVLDTMPGATDERVELWLSLVSPTKGNNSSSDDWDAEQFGGSIHYLDESGDLLTVSPLHNSLSVVYCDGSSAAAKDVDNGDDDAAGTADVVSATTTTTPSNVSENQPSTTGIVSFVKRVNHHAARRQLYLVKLKFRVLTAGNTEEESNDQKAKKRKIN